MHSHVAYFPSAVFTTAVISFFLYTPEATEKRTVSIFAHFAISAPAVLPGAL